MQKDFSGRAVFITGASSGLGRAMAIEFAQRGATVGLLARRESELQSLQQEIIAAGGRAAYRVLDITNREATLQAFSSLAAELGPCDTLIANAGLGESNTTTDLNVSGAVRVIETNLLGVMYSIEAVLPNMHMQKTGHIVGISSVASFKGLPGAAAYCASKSALSAYLESLRISFRSVGIAVTTINPGFVRTAMTAKNPSMLWVLEPDAAAKRMVKAIARRKKVYSFPKRMRLLIGLTRWLPDFIMARAVPAE